MTNHRALHEHDDEEQLGEEEIAARNRTHQPVLTGARNRILVHDQHDDDGGREEYEERDGHASASRSEVDPPVNRATANTPCRTASAATSGHSSFQSFLKMCHTITTRLRRARRAPAS